MNYDAKMILFQEAKKKHIGLLTSVLWKLTGDRELFTEAMQNALLQMWKHAHKLGGETAGAYIYRIALSANSKAWRQRVGTNGQLEHEQFVSDEKHSNQIENDEMFERVRKAISELPSQQSQAVAMRYLQHEEYTDIANHLGCGEKAARSHVSKALSALKRKFKNDS